MLFSGRMQQDLIRLMHGLKITYVSGGHLSTVLKADAFIPAIGGVPGNAGCLKWHTGLDSRGGGVYNTQYTSRDMH